MNTPAGVGNGPEGWAELGRRSRRIPVLSSSGMPIGDIAHLVGHTNTRTTEKVYRKELRPVLTKGACTMDAIFKDESR